MSWLALMIKGENVGEGTRLSDRGQSLMLLANERVGIEVNVVLSLANSRVSHETPLFNVNILKLVLAVIVMFL